MNLIEKILFGFSKAYRLQGGSPPVPPDEEKVKFQGGKNSPWFTSDSHREKYFPMGETP